jgi:hypothetical protein
MSGWQSFVDIHVPALALCAMQAEDSPAENALKEARQAAFESNVSGARVVRFVAPHYIFLSHEAEVLREVVTFVDSLR